MVEWTYERDGLVIRVSRTGSSSRIQWAGTSDARNPAIFLNPVIDECLGRVRNTEVSLELTELDYMNSSTVRPLLEMIKSLDEACNGVSVVFRDSDWQRAHRSCVTVLSRTLKRTQVR